MDVTDLKKVHRTTFKSIEKYTSLALVWHAY